MAKTRGAVSHSQRKQARHIDTPFLGALQFKSKLVDNLNAEIVLGTVKSVQEAATWMKYT